MYNSITMVGSPAPLTRIAPHTGVVYACGGLS